MTKKEIANKISEQFEMTKTAGNEIVNAVFSTIQNELEAGNDVSIHGFGTFKKVHKAAKKCRNPRTGEELMTEPKDVVKFKPVKKS
ncbi:MAG: HU family DNA-binding protein [Bacteroidales bacterium]